VIYLGLDASTTTVGYAYTDENKSILKSGFIDISSFTTIRDKVHAVLAELNLHDEFKLIECVILESALSGFMGGRTRQQTIILLAKMNATLEYVLQETAKKTVKLVNVSTARKQAFGKARIAGLKSKEYVKQKIESMFDYTKFQIMNKKNLPDKRMEDVYDAIVLSLYR
jgi:hypothetical protein